MQTVALLLAAVLFLTLPVPGSYAAEDDEGMGKTFAIGLFVVIVGVLAWVGLRSDLEDDYYTMEVKEPPYRYPDEYVMVDRLESGPAEKPLQQAAVRVHADGLQVAF
jgi:hypothetical protein